MKIKLTLGRLIRQIDLGEYGEPIDLDKMVVIEGDFTFDDSLNIVDLNYAPDFKTFMGEAFTYFTKTELNILQKLFKNQNQIVEYNQLLHMLKSMEPFSNTLSAHIKNLRNKIRKYNLTFVIYSIRGIGYQLKTINHDSIRTSSELKK